VVQDAPRVDHVEAPQPSHQLVVEDRALLDGPLGVVAVVALAQGARALHGAGIEVERHHGGAEAARGQRHQATARPDVDEAAAAQVLDAEHLA
jgi:hypothetical protein